MAGPEILKPKGVIKDSKTIVLQDGVTKGKVFPIYPNDLLDSKFPQSLVDYLLNQFNREIERGDTYPYLDTLDRQSFVDYWFGSFHALLLQVEESVELFDINESGTNWDHLWLGSFYIKPNYVGRCSHNCNAGFLVNPLKRGLSVGKNLGKVYLEWAPILGYTYSVFNLVFITNVASVKIWDALGFDRIGLVPGVGILKGYDEPVDAIIFGKKLL